MTDVKAAKKKKLESIKCFLEQHTNYRIETISDGLCVCFPHRYWTDGDGMSLYLILDDDMNKMYLEDDDLCIHNTLCMIPDDKNAKNAVRSLAKSFQILCIYGDSYNASPVFRQGLRPLSFYQEENRQDFLIEEIEEFLRKLIVFNGIADTIEVIAKVQEEFVNEDNSTPFD